MNYNERSYESILASVGNCPTMTNEDRQYGVAYGNRMKQIKKWSWDLGRAAKFYGPDNQSDYVLTRIFRSETINAGLSNAEQADANDSLEAGRSNAEQPKDAPERAVRAARWYVENYGYDSLPETFHRCERYRELFIAILILGHKGRRFSFAENRMAKAFGYPSGQTIGNFMRVCMKEGYVQCVSYGRSNDPKCRKEYHSQRAGAANVYVLAHRKERNMVLHITRNMTSCRVDTAALAWREILGKECAWIYTPVPMKVG